MPTLTPGVTISAGDVVTRQTLYDLLALAGLSGNVQASDLSPTLLTIVSQSLAPATLTPGLVWYDQTEQVVKVGTDYLDGTCVSCWLAFGPDAFDVALYAAEPIPYGAGVVPAPNLGLRAVTPPTDPGSIAICSNTDQTSYGRFLNLQFMGVHNQAHPTEGPYVPYTVPSGTWFAARIYGKGIFWAPGSRGNPTLDASCTAGQVLGWASGASGMTNPSGISNIRGSVQGYGPIGFAGSCFARALHDCRPHHPTTSRQHYVDAIIDGPRWRWA